MLQLHCFTVAAWHKQKARVFLFHWTFSFVQFAADLAGVGFSSWESPERRRNYVGEGEQHKANSEALTKRKAKMFQLLKSRYLEWYF